MHIIGWTHLDDKVKEIETKDGKIVVEKDEKGYWVNDGRETYFADRVYLDPLSKRVRAKFDEAWKEYIL